MGEYKALSGMYIRYSSLTNLKYQVDSSGYMVLRWDSFDNSSGTYQDIRYNVYIAESKMVPTPVIQQLKIPILQNIRKMVAGSIM